MNPGTLPLSAFGGEPRNLGSRRRRQDSRQGSWRRFLQLKPVEFPRVRIPLVRVDPNLLAQTPDGQMGMSNQPVMLVGPLFMHMEERSLHKRQHQRHTQLNCDSDPHSFFVQPTTLAQPRPNDEIPRNRAATKGSGQRYSRTATNQANVSSHILSVYSCPTPRYTTPR